VLFLCDISLYSVVEQQLKCNIGDRFNCLIQFLLTKILSIEEHIFLVEHIFREGNRYTDLMQEPFAEKFPETPVPHCNAVRKLTEKLRETGSVLDAELSGRPSKINYEKLLDISDSMLQSPSKSSRKLAQEERIGLATAYKVVRKQLKLLKRQ
jgi:hypothetical protein